MKKYILIAMMIAAASAMANNKWNSGSQFGVGEIEGDGYTLVNDAQGYSYMLIDKDMMDFAFHSDFKSIGNSGKVGVFFYEDGLEGQALKDYIANYDANDAKFMKKINDGEVVIGDVEAGDRVGFYLLRNNGDLVRDWNFEYFHDVAYIAFEKNGSGKDEWMSVEGGSYSGAPLPGSLAVMLIGGLLAGAKKLRKQRA